MQGFVIESRRSLLMPRLSNILILQVKALLLISLLIGFFLLLISLITMKLRLQHLNLLQLVLYQLSQNAHSVFDILETLGCT